MLTVMFDKKNEAPIWTRWNSRQDKKLKEKKIIQSVWYLLQINASPTFHSVVTETLKISLKMADKANWDSISVTYDLAITKIALQVQAEEKSTFDRIFISLGSFHIEVAFFSAIGKVIAESGGLYILSECAKGSLHSFLTGKHHNRCKRLHEILSLVLEILHFNFFKTMLNDDQIKLTFARTLKN